MMIRRNSKVLLAMAVLLAVLLAGGCTPQQNASATRVVDSAVVSNAPAAPAETSGTATAAEPCGTTVTATGTVSMKPDVAQIQLGVQTTANTADAARKSNGGAMTKVMDTLKANGVAEADITTTDFSIYPNYDNSGKHVTGYSVSNTVTAKVRNLDKLGDVLGAATQAGANWAGGVSFDVADRTAAYNEALAQAMAKARTRAEAMAKAVGVSVGQATTITEMNDAIYTGPVYRETVKTMDTAAGAAVPVSSGQMEITANITVVFQIAH